MKVNFRQVSFEGTTRELRELMENMSALGELDIPVQVQQIAPDEQPIFSDVTQEAQEETQQVLPDNKVQTKRRKRR